VHEVDRGVHARERRGQRLGPQHVARDDLGSGSDAAREVLGAPHEAAHAPAAALELRQQASADVARRTGQQQRRDR